MKALTILFIYLATRWRAVTLRTRPQLKRLQERLLARQVKYFRRASPFYRSRLTQGVNEAPVMSKRLMMANFGEMNTAGISLQEAMDFAIRAEETREFSGKLWDRYTVGLSSGTSGSRGIFLVSPEELLRYAGTFLGKAFPFTRLPQPHRIAFFLRANSNLYSVTGGSFFRFRFHDLLVPMEKHIQDLSTFHPTIIIGPPSVLRQIALAVEKGAPIHPKRVISVAEVLDDFDRELLERVFRLTIHQVYQATEGFLGISCDEGTVHLNEDFLKVEKDWIPGRERAFHPIITDLRRITQPMIRYRLDDILVERERPCPCGSPLLGLERIEGRADDLFQVRGLKEGREEWRGIFPDFVRRAILLSSERIQDFRAVQIAPDRVSLQILCEDDSRDEVKTAVVKAIGSLFKDQGAAEPQVDVAWKLTELGLSKLRRVARAFDVSPTETESSGASLAEAMLAGAERPAGLESDSLGLKA